MRVKVHDLHHVQPDDRPQERARAARAAVALAPALLLARPVLRELQELVDEACGLMRARAGISPGGAWRKGEGTGRGLTESDPPVAPSISSMTTRLGFDRFRRI